MLLSSEYFLKYTCRFQLYGGNDKEVISQHWNEWLSIAHCLESSIRKAAKSALGKNKVKVQTFLNSGMTRTNYNNCYSK